MKYDLCYLGLFGEEEEEEEEDVFLVDFYVCCILRWSLRVAIADHCDEKSFFFSLVAMDLVK